MKYGELKDVLDSHCEIGMYEPKSGSSKEIVVINFFVTELEAGKDITKFLKYSAATIVDSTVDGSLSYDSLFKIFVEVEINDALYDNTMLILKELSGLGGIYTWHVKVYRKDERDISIESIDHHLRDKWDEEDK